MFRLYSGMLSHLGWISGAKNLFQFGVSALHVLFRIIDMEIPPYLCLGDIGHCNDVGSLNYHLPVPFILLHCSVFQ